MTKAGKQLGDSLQALREVMTHRGLRRVVAAWAFSVTAEWTYVVALSVFAYRTGGVVAVGVLTVVRMVPAAIVAPFASVLADRYRRERILMGVEILRAVAIAASAALLATSQGPSGMVFALAGVVAMVASVQAPAQSALLPSLVSRPEELTAANVAVSTIGGLGTLIGPALAGVLLATTSTAVACGLAAALYAGAALWLSGVRVQERSTRRVQETGVLREALSGFRALAHEAHPRLLVGMFGAQTMVRGSLNVLIVVSAITILGLGASGVGYLTAAIGAGGLLGALVTVMLIGRRRLATPFGVGIVLWGLPIALIGLWPVPGVAFACLLVLGVGNSIVDVAGLTLLQRTVADHVLARVLGVLEGLALAGVAVGAAVGPLLTSRFGIRVALIVTGAVLPTAAVAMWGRLRRIDRDVEGPGEAFALLHGLPFFEPLPLPTVEYLAAHSTPVRVAAGGVLMRQGDPGDRFYVIAEGKADVSADGRSVAMLGPGDYFGEIALLRDVPRTATVTAAEDLRLFALAGPEFVAAVTGHPVSAETADAAAVSRLQALGGLGAR